MSKVTFDEFASKFAEELEIEGHDFLNQPLDAIAEFDSMGKISTSLVIENLFNFEIEFEVLEQEESVRSLYNYCIEKCE